MFQAKSGTGETLVYILTALYGLDVTKPRLQALVVAPTREIAVQGARGALDVGAAVKELKVSTFIGGTSVEDDVRKLRRCHFALGTPGRLRQLIEEGHMDTSGIRLFALDEADKLMDPSFVNDVTV